MDRISVVIRPEEPEGDDARRVELARLLRQELLALDVDEVRLERSSVAPEGARAVGEEIGNLIAILASSVPLLTSVVEQVSLWLGRSSASRTARLTIDGDELELTGLDAVDQRRLIDAWIDRHVRAARNG